LQPSGFLYLLSEPRHIFCQLQLQISQSCNFIPQLRDFSIKPFEFQSFWIPWLGIRTEQDTSGRLSKVTHHPDDFLSLLFPLVYPCQQLGFLVKVGFGYVRICQEATGGA
jgi:hypothetical protein